MGKYTESGLWEGTGTIVDAHFGIKQDYNPTAHLLMLDIDTDDAMMTEPFQESWSVGDRWTTNDGGETLSDPAKPDRKKVNGSSQYGRFIERAVELSGGEGGEVDKRLDPNQDNQVNVTQASVWKGLRFRFERESQERKIRGETITSEKLMPVEYLGVAGKADAGQAPAGKASASASTTPAPSSATGNGLSDEARAELQVIAMASDSHNAFIDKAMGAECVKADRNLVREIAKPDVWESLKAG